MTIKSDKWIERMCVGRGDRAMITPFEPVQVKEVPGEAVEQGPGRVSRVSRKVVSFGCSSYGYDLRVADEWKVFTNTFCGIVDPKNLDTKAFVDVKADHVLIPPNSFALARSVERFVIPDDVLGVVLGKSTYARCGIVVNVTPLEPGWEGYVTIEVSNTTPLPAKIYSNEGVAQVLFFQSDERCKTTYADKKGKYQDQPANIVLPRI